jgi:membrane protein YqaA with SNARE-associated domain
MRALFSSLLAYFLTPAGLILMGALDSSMVFFLPLGIDVAVIVLAARRPDLFWLYAILAATGSILGAAGTFWVGRKLGDHGLARLMPPSRLERIRRRIGSGASYSVAALAMIPPPFPFTAFLLGAGALGVRARNFLATLFGARLLRFGVEAGLAARYGRRLLSWMNTTTFEIAVGVLIALAVIGTLASAVSVFRATRHHESGRAAA